MSFHDCRLKCYLNKFQSSPLYLHLSPGTIITKLDDTELGTKNTSIDIWTKYLTGATQNISTGWCLTRNTLSYYSNLQIFSHLDWQCDSLDKSVSCCNPASTEESPFACFVSIDHDDRGCLDPLPIFTRPISPRCTSTKDCHTGLICLLPDKGSQLLRLTVRPSLAGIDDETVVVWSGSRREVWEEGKILFFYNSNFIVLIISVQVGNWLPRLWFLPLWLPPFLDIFWQYVYLASVNSVVWLLTRYLTMATLSLYFFNLLPLPNLDGTELLLSNFDILFDKRPFVYDVEALETQETSETTRMRRRWRQRLSKIIPPMTMTLLICCIILGMMNTLFWNIVGAQETEATAVVCVMIIT